MRVVSLLLVLCLAGCAAVPQMASHRPVFGASVQVQNLPPVSSVAGGDNFVDDQAGTTKIATADQLGDYLTQGAFSNFIYKNPNNGTNAKNSGITGQYQDGANAYTGAWITLNDDLSNPAATDSRGSPANYPLFGCNAVITFDALGAAASGSQLPTDISYIAFGSSNVNGCPSPYYDFLGDGGGEFTGGWAHYNGLYINTQANGMDVNRSFPFNPSLLIDNVNEGLVANAHLYGLNVQKNDWEGALSSLVGMVLPDSQIDPCPYDTGQGYVCNNIFLEVDSYTAGQVDSIEFGNQVANDTYYEFLSAPNSGTVVIDGQMIVGAGWHASENEIYNQSTFHGTVGFDDVAVFANDIRDFNGATGTAGQVLTSLGGSNAGVAWADTSGFDPSANITFTGSDNFIRTGSSQPRVDSTDDSINGWNLSSDGTLYWSLLVGNSGQNNDFSLTDDIASQQIITATHNADLNLNPTTGVTVSGASAMGGGTINVPNGYYSNDTPGVSCSGTPTSSYATVNGIVTHC